MAVRFTSWFLPMTGTTSKFKAWSGAERSSKNITEQESINLLTPPSPKNSQLLTKRAWIYFFLPLLHSGWELWTKLERPHFNQKISPRSAQTLSIEILKQQDSPTKCLLSCPFFSFMSNSRTHKQILPLKSGKGNLSFFFFLT